MSKENFRAKDLVEHSSLTLNEQELVRSIGMDPDEFKNRATEGEEFLTLGNIISGYWSNNWQNIE